MWRAKGDKNQDICNQLFTKSLLCPVPVALSIIENGCSFPDTFAAPQSRTQERPLARPVAAGPDMLVSEFLSIKTRTQLTIKLK